MVKKTPQSKEANNKDKPLEATATKKDDTVETPQKEFGDKKSLFVELKTGDSKTTYIQYYEFEWFQRNIEEAPTREDEILAVVAKQWEEANHALAKSPL